MVLPSPSDEKVYIALSSFSSLCTPWHRLYAQRLVVIYFLWYMCHYLRSTEPKLEPAILTLRVTHIIKSSLWWIQEIHYNRPSVSNLLCLFPRHMSVHLFFSSIIGDVSRLWRGSSLCWNMTRTCQSSNIFRAVKSPAQTVMELNWWEGKRRKILSSSVQLFDKGNCGHSFFFSTPVEDKLTVISCPCGPNLMKLHVSFMTLLHFLIPIRQEYQLAVERAFCIVVSRSFVLLGLPKLDKMCISLRVSSNMGAVLYLACI